MVPELKTYQGSQKVSTEFQKIVILDGPLTDTFSRTHEVAVSLFAFLFFAASTARGSWYNSTGRSTSVWLEELYQGLKEFDPEYKNPCFTTESGEWRCLPYFNVIGAPVIPLIKQTL